MSSSRCRCPWEGTAKAGRRGERAEPYLVNPKQMHWIVEIGTERVRTVPRETMREVRDAMGINY